MAVAAVFALASVVRALYLAEYAATELFLYPVVDAYTYDQIARELAVDGRLSDELFWQPPFYPLFLGALYKLSGASMLAARIAGLFVGALTCALTCRLGARIAGPTAGVIAGVMAALYGPLIHFDGELLGTSWACFWSVSVLSAFCGLTRADTHRSPRSAWLVGLLCGFGVLSWPPLLPFVVFAAAAVAFIERRTGQSWGSIVLRSTALGAGVLLVLLPVAALAGRVTGRASFLPASAGLNLWIGNNPERETTVAIRPGWDWEKLTDLPWHDGVRVKHETSRWFTKKVVEYATSQPIDFAKGLGAKTLELACSRELPRNLDPYLLRASSRVLAASMWKIGAFGFPFGVLLPLAVVGFLWGRPRLPWIVIAFVAIQAGMIVLVFVSGRYRAPLIPVMCLAAAVGVLSVRDVLRARRWGAAAAIAGVMVLVVSIATLPGPFVQERTNYGAELHYLLARRASDRGDGAGAIAHFERAIALEPRHADAHTSLATVLSATGRSAEAIAHLDQALAADSDHAIALANLGRALAARGYRTTAAEKLRAAVEVDPFDPVLLADYATSLTWIGKEAEAEGVFARAHELGGSSADLFTRWGRLLLFLERLEEAEAKLTAALALDPLHIEAVEALAAKHLRSGRIDRAAETYRVAAAAAREADKIELAERWRERAEAWARASP